ncbi:MAG: cytochrome c3 family protein [Coriobacteriales bacterium]|jgi:hypothetical protein|nr:cytochrome c3 family protein [Coriobacteriales bacterium]
MDNEEDFLADETTASDAEQGVEPDITEATDVAGNAKKRSHTKLIVVLSVLAVVLVAGGVGGFIWHEQPTFCNALCHQPMDPYVESFYSGDNTLLVTAHADNDTECLACHVPTIAQQFSEATKWATGDFKDPLAMTKTGTREFCLACHDVDAIKTTTINYGGSARNPHDSHYGDQLECYSCHRVHRTSTLYCSECHKDISGPPGWDA